MKRIWVCVALVGAVAGCPQAGGPLTYGEAEAYCIADVACFGNGGEYIASCIAGHVGREYPARYRCITEAASRGDCAGVRACAGYDIQLDGSCTSSSSYSSSCSGNDVVGCSPGGGGTVAHLYRGNCASFEAACYETTSGAGCYRGTCSWDGGRCSSSTHSQYCYEGLLGDDYECPAGTLCRETSPSSGGSSYTNCVGSEPCTRSTCDGNSLRYCNYIDSSTGRLSAPDDCGRTGAHCVLDSEGAHCEADGFECDPTAFDAACNGNSLRYCGADGHIHSYDCRGHGYAGCRDVTTSFDSYGYCVPSGIDLHL